jgi:hypothetical protein
MNSANFVELRYGEVRRTSIAPPRQATPSRGYYGSYVQSGGLVVVAYIRNALRHRSGPIRIEKPGHSVEGELKSARLGD